MEATVSENRKHQGKKNSCMVCTISRWTKHSSSENSTEELIIAAQVQKKNFNKLNYSSCMQS